MTTEELQAALQDARNRFIVLRLMYDDLLVEKIQLQQQLQKLQAEEAKDENPDG